MSKKAKKNRLKLPKRIGGVTIPKDARKSINKLLKDLPAPAAKPMLTAAVGALVAALATKLEDPIREMIQTHTEGTKTRARRPRAAPTAH